jgi:quinol monooxygenase YgiN
LVTISTFTTASAYEERLASQAAQDLVNAVKTQNLLASPPSTHRLDPITGFHKPSLKSVNLNEVFIVFAHCDVHPDGFSAFMPAAHGVVEYCEANEPGTLAYDICKSVEHGEKKGYALEMYENQAYFHDPHMQNLKVQEVVKQIGENAEFRDWWEVKVIGGFLTK